MSHPYGFIGGMNPPQLGPGMPPPGYMQGPPIGPQAGPGITTPLNPVSLSSGMNHGLNPATNNQPLQFNTNKNKPPMAMPLSQSPDKTSPDDMVLSNDNGDGSPPMGLAPIGVPGGPPMNPPWGPMMGPVGMGDPNMMMGPMGFNQFGGFMGPNMGMDNTIHSKEVITLKACTLYPPPPNAPPPSTREKPPGCRTIFVGGLPENITEVAIREIFEEFGTITSVRTSKKNFAHIRYDMMDAVEKALFLSGYRIKLENQDDKANTGRIHVDYAQARDDLYEFECSQRAYARDCRHRQRMEEDMLRPPSPPPIVHFSDHESSVLLEKLKSEESFMVATQVVMTWLERGDCTRRSANNFYSLLQSTNSHVRRLLSEKSQYDDEFEMMKQKFKQRHEGLLKQFEQIEKVFVAATMQKAWDHFSKAQRKNLDVWRKQCQDLHAAQKQEFFKDRHEAEMEMSDSDGESEAAPPKKKKNGSEYTVTEWIQMSHVRDENDSLKCQLEAYKNEVDLLKQESKNAVEYKDKQLKALQQALQGMQQQLIACKQQVKKSESESVQPKPTVVVKASPTEVTTIDDSGSITVVDLDPEPSPPVIEKSVSPPVTTSVTTVTTPSEPITDKEARLIAVMSTFLHVHPFGASIDYIWSYLQKLNILIRSSELEETLEKFPSLFKLDLLGVGASLEKRWKFVGFDSTLLVV